MMAFPFTLSADTTAPVGVGEVRLSGPPPYRGRVSLLWIHDVDRDGAIVKWIVMNLKPPTAIYLQAPDGAAVLQMTGPPIDRPGYVEIPVTCTAHDGWVAAGDVELSFVPKQAAL